MEEKKRYYVITYKDKEIIYVDYSGLSGNDLLNSMKKGYNFQKEKEIGLTLCNFTDVIVSQEVMDYLKSDEVIQITKTIVKKNACIGIIGVKKIFLNIFNKFTSGKTLAFDTEEEAKEWLVKD